MDVVLLAGGKLGPEFADVTQETLRALLPFEGRAMVDHVLDAVRHVGDVVLVGPVDRPGVRCIPAGEQFIHSLSAGLAEVRTDQFLMATTDLCFLTREAVDDFLARCESGALLNYPVVPMDAAEARFPGMKRTTLKLKEGEFTGGNIAVVNTAMMRAALPKMEQAYEARKSVLKLGQIVGFKTLVTLVVGKLIPGSVSLLQLEQQISRALGGKVRGIQTPFAEIGADVDTLEQFLALEPGKNGKNANDTH